MYTDLRGAIVLKNEYIEVIKNYIDSSISDSDYNLLLEKHLILKQFDEFERGGSGMFGSELFFFPLTEKEDLFTPRVEGNVWYFKAEIKNYLDPKYDITPYEFFLEKLVPQISKEILLLETRYEEFERFGQWYLDANNNKIKENIIQFDEPIYSYTYSYSPDSEHQTNNKDMFEKFKAEYGLEIWND